MVTANVQGRYERLRDGLAAIRGTVICALVVFFFDVVLDGSYLVAALVCPLWFLIAAVRAIAKRPSAGVAAARVLLPVVTGLLVIANYSVQGRIAVANAGLVIEACYRYREVNGAFPERLGDLVPRHLNSIPRAKYCCVSSEFEYRTLSSPTLSWLELPPFGRRVYVFETGKWRYVD